jgi:hypothetical protein
MTARGRAARERGRADSTFGIMPPAMRPSAIRSATCARRQARDPRPGVADVVEDAGHVGQEDAGEPSAAATAPATSSALTLSGAPSASTRGTPPPAPAPRPQQPAGARAHLAHGADLAERGSSARRSAAGVAAGQRHGVAELAREPLAEHGEARSTIGRLSGVVTRRPRSKRLAMPAAASSAAIAGPPPWTSTGAAPGRGQRPHVGQHRAALVGIGHRVAAVLDDESSSALASCVGVAMSPVRLPPAMLRCARFMATHRFRNRRMARPDRRRLHRGAGPSGGSRLRAASAGHRPGPVLVAHDTRFGGPMFQARGGGDVLRDLGLPVAVHEGRCRHRSLSFAVRELGAVGGVMLTASHNPAPLPRFKLKDRTAAAPRAPPTWTSPARRRR